MNNDVIQIINGVWSEWEIEKELGHGGYATVYRAIRKDTVERYAAIKVISVPTDDSIIDTLRSEGLSNEATKTTLYSEVEDIVNEIKIMVSLHGLTNVVNIEDYKVVERKDTIGWYILIRMELLTPISYYFSDRTVTEKDIIKLGCDICTALEYCKTENIVHRDIKPGNILVDSFGNYKLGDFGIAKSLTKYTTLSQRYTPDYVAPEVVKHEKCDDRLDIYSLGLVLYQYMNHNRLPFLDIKKQLLTYDEREQARERRIYNGEPLNPPCDASPAMAQLILRACEYDPSNRFASATEMKNALLSVANGTYSGNSTISVRKAQSNNPNATISVRQAPHSYKGTNTVHTFGDKKKSNVPTVIISAFIILLLVGGGIFAVPKLFNNDTEKGSSTESSNVSKSSTDENNQDTEDDPNIAYSDYDEEQISAAIEEAEVLASKEDYEGALATIKTALATYSESKTLKEKEKEYTDALAEQVKSKTLEEAANLAESGDYVSAIALIKDAQDTYGDDADYTSAYNTYCSSYKTEIISAADELAENGDYLGAIQKITEATVIIGDDSELTAKSQGYEDSYVTDVISKADALLIEGEIDSAEKLINEAKKQFPNNEMLITETDKIENSRPVYLLNEVKPYKTPYNYEDKGTISMGGKSYTHGFTCMGYGDKSIGNEMYFNLDGKYSSISFTAGIVSDSGKSVSFSFYADGEIVYSFIMDSGDLPTEHTINVENSKQLVISVYDGYSTAMYSGTYGIADIMATKNLTNTTTTNTNSSLKDGEFYLLSTIDPYKTPYNYEENGTFNMGGQSYSHGFTCMGYGDKPVGNEIYFNLDGEYSTLKFTAGIVHDAGSVHFSVYVDGEMIYDFEMESGALPTEHTVDITGCKQLVFAVFDGRSVAMYSGTYGIADIIVST